MATEAELRALPHLTAALVKGIIDRRPFPTMKDLNAVLAQPPNATQLMETYRRMFVQINLNTASNLGGHPKPVVNRHLTTGN